MEHEQQGIVNSIVDTSTSFIGDASDAVNDTTGDLIGEVTEPFRRTIVIVAVIAAVTALVVMA